MVARAPTPLPPAVSVLCREQCCAVLRRAEGGRGGGAAGGVSPVRAGALGWEAGEPRGQHVAPQLPVWGGTQGPGHRGTSGCGKGSRTRWTPVTAVTSCVRRKMCTLSRAVGAWSGGRGTGAAPYRYRWVGVIPRTRSGSPRVAIRGGAGGCPGALARGPALCGGHPWSWRGGGIGSGWCSRGVCASRAGGRGSLGNALL